MHQKLINLQAVRAGPMWTIPQRRRARIAGTCGARERSPTRTVTATAGKTGRPTGRTQEGRARPENLLRQQKMHGMTFRTLLTLLCTAGNRRLCWLMVGRKFYTHLEYHGWPFWSVCASHSFSFLLPRYREKKSSIWIFSYIKVALPFLRIVISIFSLHYWSWLQQLF